ncbi:MAG: WYL domain-containing protein [Corynebacteriales bacterium]|nr:WYL domain-containing protein [Mycobacteriales bacterium]
MKTNDRLSRLLVLVPYFLARPGIALHKAADDLGISEAELADDLQLLFVCGLPGYGPGELIDMSLGDGTVTITYDAGMSRPLRLSAQEAVALVVALRALAEVPGLAAGDVVARALDKVEQAAGDLADAASQVSVRTQVSAATMRVVSGAVNRQHVLELTYYSAGRDELTERVVDPMRVLLRDGHSYLEAWCRTAGAVRIFRLDRIDGVVERDEPSAPPSDARASEIQDGVFRPSANTPLIELRVGRESRWIADYYPCETVRTEPDGRIYVAMYASDLDWARRRVMALPDDVEVLAPVELAQAVVAEARAALAAYQ